MKRFLTIFLTVVFSLFFSFNSAYAEEQSTEVYFYYSSDYIKQNYVNQDYMNMYNYAKSYLAQNITKYDYLITFQRSSRPTMHLFLLEKETSDSKYYAGVTYGGVNIVKSSEKTDTISNKGFKFKEYILYSDNVRSAIQQVNDDVVLDNNCTSTTGLNIVIMYSESDRRFYDQKFSGGWDHNLVVDSSLDFRIKNIKDEVFQNIFVFYNEESLYFTYNDKFPTYRRVVDNDFDVKIEYNFRKEFDTTDVKAFSFNSFETTQDPINLKIEYVPRNDINASNFDVSVWYSTLDDTDIYSFYECEECSNFVGLEQTSTNVFEVTLYDIFNQIKQIHSNLNAIEVHFQATNFNEIDGTYKVYDDTNGLNNGWSKVDIWKQEYKRICTNATDFLISSAYSSLNAGSIIIDNKTLEDTSFRVYKYKYDQQANFDEQILSNPFTQDSNYSIFEINLDYSNKQIIKVSSSSSEQKCFYTNSGFTITEISAENDEKVEIDTPDGKIEIDVNDYESVNNILDYVNRFLNSIKKYVNVFFDLISYLWSSLNDNIKGLIISLFVLLLVSAVIAVARK